MKFTIMLLLYYSYCNWIKIILVISKWLYAYLFIWVYKTSTCNLHLSFSCIQRSPHQDWPYWPSLPFYCTTSGHAARAEPPTSSQCSGHFAYQWRIFTSINGSVSFIQRQVHLLDVCVKLLHQIRGETSWRSSSQSVTVAWKTWEPSQTEIPSWQSTVGLQYRWIIPQMKSRTVRCRKSSTWN